MLDSNSLQANTMRSFLTIMRMFCWTWPLRCIQLSSTGSGVERVGVWCMEENRILEFSHLSIITIYHVYIVTSRQINKANSKDINDTEQWLLNFYIPFIYFSDIHY